MSAAPDAPADAVLALLREWMPHQRWYAGKGHVPSLRRIAEWELSADAQARVRVLLVEDTAVEPAVLYQVPFVIRRRADAAGDAIGRLDDGAVLVDGATDPAFTRTLFRWVTGGGRAEGVGGAFTGKPLGDRPRTAEVAGEALGGEQSNTSLVYRPGEGAAPIICKLFRQVGAGVNPDIEIQTALAGEGSPFVPAAVGVVDGSWHDPSTGAVVTGSLAFAQEFFPGVEDAWRVALRAAAAGEDFSERAGALGEATAEVHRSLAALFPTREPGPRDIEAASRVWEGRLATAAREVPGVRAHAALIAAEYDRALSARWPRLQRIHGDLHLGQVLDVAGRGWVLLDFEGEPLRPLRERRAPDAPARDVAGMLRSFDYVAGSIRRERPDDPGPREWADAARAAFLRGYAAQADLPDAALLRALELDKAVYEALYESRNRPDWLGIPLAALERLAAR